MRRYVTRAANCEAMPDGEHYLARTVYEPDNAPRPTGLLDKHGNKLFAVDEMGPIGFVVRRNPNGG